MHDLHISVNDRMISPFREDFIFTKLRLREVCENKTLAKIVFRVSEESHIFSQGSRQVLESRTQYKGPRQTFVCHDVIRVT